ncbi:hypothetical protein [Ferrovibrio sp.]|uniref:hypothetical protein n=1 Tax=Ferrovibrio sp. TaxID=1917215 RepID=UPI0025BEC18C|nr:hypothetical protein [Ferrovibrio sp.]MBX3454533.1 hypothetical protein [Ferrovibrio sp.]
MLKATMGCVAAGLLLFGCVGANTGDEARLNQRHWRGAAGWDAAMAREEADFLRRPEARASRDAGGLQLLLADGRRVTVAEDRSCRAGSGIPSAADILRDCVRKHAIARFAERGYWLLAVRLREGEAYALVSERDGRETMLIGPPYFSPDGRHLAAVNKSLQGDTVNGIEVWRLDASGPELVFFHEEKDDAGYDFTDWFSADTARLSYRGCIGKPDVACERPREAVLTGRGGKWRLVPWTR